MNRPTIDVDDILGMAEEALAARDYAQAVTILRKAAAVAPLRKDIRNRLAMALERSPVTRKSNYVNSKPETPIGFSEVEMTAGLSLSEFPHSDAGETNGREAIGQIAKKAFEAASEKTARAGIATRNLTNLLHQGIQTWKSSLADQVKPVQPSMNAATEVEEAESPVSGAIHSGVFTPEADLDEYLKRTESTNSRTYTKPVNFDTDEEPDSPDEINRISRPVPISKKSARNASSKRTTARQRDVEDVLAAGIDGFIEVVARSDRKKIIYGIVYATLGLMFTYACFDVSRKFPGVRAIPGRSVQAAGLGGLNLADTRNSNDAIAQAHKIAAEGKVTEAIDLLRAQLKSDRVLVNRDNVRIELASMLNDQAEKHLKNNRLADSVSLYRQALKVLPGDGALRLRLGNALYYQGTVGGVDEAAKKAALSEAAKVLGALISQDNGNIQGHRLLALTYEARGDKNDAKGSWEKVKALAAADSPELKEATSHLK